MVITYIGRLIAPLITAHEPPSDSKYRIPWGPLGASGLNPRHYVDPKKPTCLGFLIMISLYSHLNLVAEWIHSTLFGIIVPTIKLKV